jgi:hypothetical protein
MIRDLQYLFVLATNPKIQHKLDRLPPLRLYSVTVTMDQSYCRLRITKSFAPVQGTGTDHQCELICGGGKKMVVPR